MLHLNRYRELFSKLLDIDCLVQLLIHYCERLLKHVQLMRVPKKLKLLMSLKKLWKLWIYPLLTLMLHLLLVSIQVMILRMALFDSTHELISFKDQNNSKINLTSEKDPILCNHCKRTASNGIRCLGICVADNDY